MKLLLNVALAGVLLGSATVRADDTAEAKKILDKAIEAAGGKEKLSKHNAMTWQEKGLFYGMGNELPYTADYAMQFPDQFLMNIHNVFKIVLDGDKGWASAGGSTVELNEEQIKETKEQVYAGWVTTLVPVLGEGFKLEMIEGVDVDSKPTVAVKVSHRDHRDVKLYFDKQTYLLAKSEHTVLAEEQGGKEVNQEEIYSDYKAIEGLQVPTKTRVLREGNKYVEAEQHAIELKQTLDKSVFAKP